MKQARKDLRQWKCYLTDAAKTLVAEDRVTDAGKLFIQCHEWAIKQKDGFCLTDGGAFELIMGLMQNAQNSKQAKQVEYFLDEFFPEMHPSWHGRYRPLANELMAMRIRCEPLQV